MSTAVSPERHPAQQHRDGLPPHPAYRRHNNDDVGLDPANHSQGPLSSSNTQPGYMSDHPINVSHSSGVFLSSADHIKNQIVPSSSQWQDTYSYPPPNDAQTSDELSSLSEGFNNMAMSDYAPPRAYENYSEHWDGNTAQYPSDSRPSRSDEMVYTSYATPARQDYGEFRSASVQPTAQERYSNAAAQEWPTTGHDPYLSAASNVLGMGPPPDTQGVYDTNYNVLQNYYPPRADNENGYSYGEVTNAPYADEHASSGVMLHRDPSTTLTLRSHDSSDTDSTRPSLHRSGTTGSVSLGTRRTKAVDLSAPPYTKEFIDQYRQRIKGDPDPEAHFQYAKYLIDAAKKIGANAADQRAVRKYRELLIQEALKIMRKLATQGDAYAEAQFFLANCHGTGMLGLQVDHERAYHLYLQAAKQNHSAASYRVAVCNEIGAGTKRDPPRAFAFYRKAASLGDTAAMYKLGMVLLSGGLTQARNPREAVAWLRRAAEQADEENPHALHELGLLHENTESQIVPHDPLYAKNLFTKAATLGYTQSQFKLGQCYEYGSLTCPVDPRRSIAWYTKAAEKGNAEAELALSGWYLTGNEGVLKQSDSEAYLWARRAANKGLSKAEYAVGYYAEIGIGVKPDIELAKRWYMRAAAQGNKRAMNRLTELKRMGNRRAQAARPTRQQAKDECVVT